MHLSRAESNQKYNEKKKAEREAAKEKK